MRLVWVGLLGLGVALVLAGPPAAADWQPADGHKMHFPQLPDLDGWDVNASGGKRLADDWRCSQTGPVSDIHFWGSWAFGQTGIINAFNITIYSDDPVGPGGTDPANNFSKPDQILWQYTAEDFNIVPIDPPSTQGWYDPPSTVRPGDHSAFFQYNIDLLPNPFTQLAGTVYWLGINANVSNGTWGWKTADVMLYPAPYTGMHFMDDAVWRTGVGPWQELFDPQLGESLDLAFVITPEPATLALLLAGGALLLRRR